MHCDHCADVTSVLPSVFLPSSLSFTLSATRRRITMSTDQVSVGTIPSSAPCHDCCDGNMNICIISVCLVCNGIPSMDDLIGYKFTLNF